MTGRAASFSCAGRAGHPRPESKQNDNVGENKAPLALALIQSRAGHTESAFSPDGTFALAWQADRRVDADSGGRSRARDTAGGRQDVDRLRIVRELLHPIAQLRRVNVQVLGYLYIRYASILDQGCGA